MYLPVWQIRLLRLATDLPCHSASPCVYCAVVSHAVRTAGRVQAAHQCTSELRRRNHHLSFNSSSSDIFSLSRLNCCHHPRYFVNATCWSVADGCVVSQEIF